MSTTDGWFEPVPSVVVTNKNDEEFPNKGVDNAKLIAASEHSFVIRCTNADGDEDIVETIDLQNNKPADNGRRKKFGSFAFGTRKSSKTSSANHRTRKSLPVNIGSTENSEADFAFNLKTAYQKTFCKVSRHNSVVPQ
ncbi:hypothetical protein AVEN_82301-1, partial [Araneus ventricosus]